MTRVRALRIGVMAVLVLTQLVPQMAVARTSGTGPSEGSSGYIVLLEGVAPGAVSAVAAELTAEVGGELGHVYRHALQGFSLRVDATGAARLAELPSVDHVERDGLMRTVASQPNPTWGLDRIDQRDRPLDHSFTYNSLGTGVHAYIIDTGIRISHQDLGGRASHGRDAVNNDNVSDDCNGHGTHVAGTVGGTSFGVAKNVSLVAVRVLGCAGTGPTSDVIEGVDWVTGNATRPAVANMSLGGGASTALDNAVRNSINSGITYALAAGNGNFLGQAQNACNTSPARVADAVTVSATDSSDRKASFANYGNCVDIFAPGVSITSAWSSSDTATDTISGTSMASPHVAGAAAQYLEGNPSASPATVASALIASASTGKVTNPGSGSPNRLLFTADIAGGGGGGGGGGGEENTVPNADFTSSCIALSCSFTDASTDVDGTIGTRTWDFGDGTTSTEVNPTHSYATAGTYTVTLTVTDDDGASDSASQAVTVTSTSDPDPGTPTLTSGTAASDTNGASGTWKYYKVQVPAGRSQLRVELAGTASCGLLSCNPDLDLYVRQGAKPTTSSYNCAPLTGSSTESCTINSPAAD